jgi:hypothetical protein
MRNKIAIALLALMAVFTFTGCQSPADVASANTSKEADQFHVLRRVTVINGITDKFLMTIEGYCSLGNQDPTYEQSITCRVAGGDTSDMNDDRFKKHFIRLGDNITVLTEQLEAINVSTNRYEVIFQPTAIVPDIVIP